MTGEEIEKSNYSETQKHRLRKRFGVLTDNQIKTKYINNYILENRDRKLPSEIGKELGISGNAVSNRICRMEKKANGGEIKKRTKPAYNKGLIGEKRMFVKLHSKEYTVYELAEKLELQVMSIYKALNELGVEAKPHLRKNAKVFKEKQKPLTFKSKAKPINTKRKPNCKENGKVILKDFSGKLLIPLGFRNMSIYVDSTLSADQIVNIKQQRLMKLGALV